MEIENEKGIFDIEKDSVISIERTNPLLSEQGSMSLPYSIKRTDKNDYLLGNPQNYERKEVFQIKQEMNIRSGLLNENATFQMLSVNSEKIEGVFYLYESSFYNLIKEVKLPIIFEGIERWFQPESISREDRVVFLANMLNDMIFSPTNESDEFTVFPTIVEVGLVTDFSIAPAKHIGMMNMIVKKVDEKTKAITWQLRAKEKYTYSDTEGSEITLPVGYGVSPFLRFNYVLRKIFKYFGFTLEENIFDTSSYRFMSVLNNTMDAILPGYFIESQLVPDCTVNEFLDIVRENFCADFVLDINNNTVRIVHFNEVLDAEPDCDLTPYIIGKKTKMEFSEPKQIKLVAKQGLPHSKSATSTIAEFRQKYTTFDPDARPASSREGIFAFFDENLIWKRAISDLRTESELLGSLGFSYATLDNIEYEEHNLAAETIVSGASGRFGRTRGLPSPIIGSQRNLNSILMFGDEIQKEESADCPIMLSLESFTDGSPFQRIGVQCYRNSENIHPPTGYNYVSLLAWDENGFFEKFWKKRDYLARTSLHQITCSAKLPATLLYSFRFDRLKLVNGQPLIPSVIRHKVVDDNFVEVEIELKTVKPFE